MKSDTDPHEHGYSWRSTFVIIASSVVISVLLTLGVLWFIVNTVPVSALRDTEKNTFNTPSPLTAPATDIDGANGAIPDIVERVSPAVVSVIITADVPVVERYYDDRSPFGDFFRFQIPRERQIGTKEQQIGGGTGFFVSQDGYIVTNRHVVDLEEVDYSIVTSDGISYDVSVVAKDPTLDIAILKVEGGSDFPYLTFGTADSIRPGETVIAIGNALSEFPNTVSVGVISGLARNITAGDMFGSAEYLEGVIQTDAAINRGNSGGPLINQKGEVIGVNVAVAGGGENIGFALPADSVKDVVLSVQEHGEIVRPFLGIRYLEITDTLQSQNDLPVNYGVLILRGDTREELAVIPGSPADRAGLEENDIILEVNGEPLGGDKSFASVIRTYKVGDTITLRVLHEGEETEVSATLSKAPTS